MRFIDVPIGVRVAVVDRFGDETGELEIRYTYYERAEGEAKFKPSYTPAFRLRTVQGVTGKRPRYDVGPYRIATELPKVQPVVLAAQTHWECATAEQERMEDPLPLIGQNAMGRLEDAGFAVVPLVATKAMCDAASQAMRLRQEAMGTDWYRATNNEKAAIRWTKMLEAWFGATVTR